LATIARVSGTVGYAAAMFDFSKSHRRYNPLTGDWVLVSPERTARPWQGQTETESALQLPAYDPSCYLCPGNERAGGVRNPAYERTFVFDNDFAALQPDTRSDQFSDGRLLLARGEPGLCRVITFSPRHDLTLARMSASEIRDVVDLWVAQYLELGSLAQINWVQIFENRGEMMGASNPHPHCQIWANFELPNEALKEDRAQESFLTQHGRCLLCEYLAVEVNAKERLVAENESFQALVPFWAVWPFETMILSRAHLRALDELDAGGREDLADILKQVTTRYDNLFHAAFPYTFGFHQRPTDGAEQRAWHLHAHFYPPLLRSATIRKFMVGYEMLAGPQRDLTAEAAAARLRATPRAHYRD